MNNMYKYSCPLLSSCSVELQQETGRKESKTDRMRGGDENMCLEGKLLSRVRLSATPWTTQSMEFSRPEYWSG